MYVQVQTCRRMKEMKQIAIVVFQRFSFETLSHMFAPRAFFAGLDEFRSQILLLEWRGGETHYFGAAVVR